LDQGPINIRSSHATLQNFEISFSNNNVNFTYDSRYSVKPAIIDDQNLGQTALIDVNILGLTILAPFDSTFSSPSYQDSLDPNGYETTLAIYMGKWDSGTIENNWIYGGTTTVQFGPWTISGNHYVGSVPGTTCPGAFAVSNGHDVTIQENQVTDPNPSQDGQILRLMALNNGGYNIDMIGNTVSQNVGDIPLNGNATNNPEEILPEVSGTIYEGSTLATSISSSTGSYNRRVIAIPSSMGAVPGRPFQ
jgi:hypothetical protein